MDNSITITKNPNDKVNIKRSPGEPAPVVKINRDYDEKKVYKSFSTNEKYFNTIINEKKDCTYLKNAFKVLDEALAYEQDVGFDFFTDIDKYIPRDAEIEVEKIKASIETIKIEEAKLRKILQDILSKGAVDTKKKTEQKYNVGKGKLNNKFDQLLEDKIDSYNHYTTYGVMMVIYILFVTGIFSITKK